MKNRIIKYSLGFVLLLVQLGYSQAPIEEGFELLESGEFNEAETFFESFIAKKPTHKTALLCYGRAVGLNGNPQKSKAIFDKLLNEDPSNLEFLINYAEALLWNKEFKVALLNYTKLAEQNPNSAIIQLGLGNTYSNLKKYKASINHYTKGISFDSSILGLYIGLAYTHHAYNQDKEALEVINKGLMIDENNSELSKLKNKIINKYKISVHQQVSATSDSGNNKAQNIGNSVDIPINTKNSIGVVYQYRNTKNCIVLNQATQHLVGINFKRDVTNRIQFSSNLSYLSSKGGIKYNVPVYKAKIEMRPRFNQSLSVNFQREYHNFNAQLIDAKIAQDHLFANYHILTEWNIGWFTQYYYTKQSDNNNRNLWFNSLYYVLKQKCIFKFGLNTQMIQFKDEHPEIYFSPKDFFATELFMDFNFKKNNYVLSGNFAHGYQFINKDRQQSFRGELNFGYKITSKFTANAFGKYSNLASGTAAGFEFNEIGINFNYLF